MPHFFVAIYGAGLAGLALANRLSSRGLPVLVMDPRVTADEIPGPPAALVNPAMGRHAAPGWEPEACYRALRQTIDDIRKATGRTDLLQKIRFIAHWTNSPLRQGTPEHPERVANCREDAAACAYLKSMALAGLIDYRECGAIGQSGIVSGAPRGAEYYENFKVSRLGQIFAEGKFVFGNVDHSDSATYWVLLGTMGVTLDDIPADGSNNAVREKANEDTFRAHSPALHEELLRRARAAAGLR
jgi:hypothetical protein